MLKKHESEVHACAGGWEDPGTQEPPTKSSPVMWWSDMMAMAFVTPSRPISAEKTGDRLRVDHLGIQQQVNSGSYRQRDAGQSVR